MNVLGVVRLLFSMVLDAVLPPRARTARTQVRSIADIPLIPTVHRLLGVEITTVMDYRAAEVQDLIRALKYDGSSAAAALAAGALADYLREELAGMRLFSAREILLAPIPLHRSRLRQRGFNQIELALRALPQEFQNGELSRVEPWILTRVRPTDPQTRLGRRERIGNMKAAFEVRENRSLENYHVIVIDDVATTGSTLKHAGLALRASGAHVTRLALARA